MEFVWRRIYLNEYIVSLEQEFSLVEIWKNGCKRSLQSYEIEKERS